MSLQKILIWVLLLIALGLLAWYVLKSRQEPVTRVDDGPIEVVVEPKTVTLIITDHPTIANACQIRAEDGSLNVTVNRGDFVVFDNQSSKDRDIKFGTVRELFDEKEFTVKIGQTKKQKVKDNADADANNPHTFQSCHEDVGPPGIIVCPPGETC